MKPIRWAALAAATLTGLVSFTPAVTAETVVPKGFAPARVITAGR